MCWADRGILTSKLSVCIIFTSYFVHLLDSVLYAVQCLYIALICGAQLIFSCMSLTERPICRQIVIHKSQSARKGGCQRTATRTYLHWLQFIFRASEWVNSYFTLLNVPLCQMRNTKWWIKTFHIFILTWSFGLFGYMTALPCGLYICNTSGWAPGLLSSVESETFALPWPSWYRLTQKLSYPPPPQKKSMAAKEVTNQPTRL